MNTRLLGAAVIVALAILFVPMFFSSKPPATTTDQSVSLTIPPAPDRDLQTKTLSLTPGSAPAASAAPVPAATVGVPQLSPVPGSNPAIPATVAKTAAPMIPVTQQPAIPTTPPSSAIKQAPAIAPQPAPVVALPPATAARGAFTINLSAYADSGASSLMQRVRGLGYPVHGEPIQRGGKTLMLVKAGPFPTRSAAETARLKIVQSIPGAPARLEGAATTPQGDMAAAPTSVPASAPAKPGGWAVQVAAMGSQADALALRDKLRASGFDGFVDSVDAGGKRLWRVRAGPQTQRSDALALRDQIKSKLGLNGNVVTAP